MRRLLFLSNVNMRYMYYIKLNGIYGSAFSFYCYTQHIPDVTVVGRISRIQSKYEITRELLYERKGSQDGAVPADTSEFPGGERER